MADMDEFAQTRGADDLFDDEIIPVTAEEQQAQTEAVVSEPELQASAETSQTSHGGPAVAERPPWSHGETLQRGRGGSRGRGRRRGRGKRELGGLQDSIFADHKRSESPQGNHKDKGPSKVTESGGNPETDETATTNALQDGEKDQSGQEEEGKVEMLSTTAAEPQRVPAVRGDRSATGGIKKVRLFP